MTSIRVKTKEEIVKARMKHPEEIILEGPLAKELKEAEGFEDLSKASAKLSSLALFTVHPVYTKAESVLGKVLTAELLEEYKVHTEDGKDEIIFTRLK